MYWAIEYKYIFPTY